MGGRIKLLLMEDNRDLRRAYFRSLVNSGFESYVLSDGYFLERFLKEYRVDILLSDTEMVNTDGPDAVRFALDKKLFNDDETLIIGMSYDSDNQKYWRGLAHFGCFYDKDYFCPNRIGEIVLQCWKNFVGPCTGWRDKMPVMHKSCVNPLL